MDFTHQDNHVKLSDGAVSMKNNSDHAFEEATSQDKSDGGSKKQKVESSDEKLEEVGILENDEAKDYQGEATVASNVCVPERVIEPTLVMFEV